MKKYAVRVKETGAYVSWPKNGRGDIKTVASLDKASLFKSEAKAVEAIDDSPLLLKRGGSILSPDEETAAWAECEDRLRRGPSPGRAHRAILALTR